MTFRVGAAKPVWSAVVSTAIAIVVALVAATAASAGAASSVSTVTCDRAAGSVRSAATPTGYRVVLGVVSVAPAYLSGQAVPSPTTNQKWPRWMKQALFIRGGSPAVVVSVPKSWRTQSGIGWGTSSGPVSALRLASCATPASKWNAYPGGFYLRASSACVPLVFQVGHRTATVRFGIGRHC